MQDAKARGIPVSFASDTTRAPFYAHGDLARLEVPREVTRIGHLVHGAPDWIRPVTTKPAGISGWTAQGVSRGAPADLVILLVGAMTEPFARPYADRIVLRGGRAIDPKVPDDSDLDDLPPCG